MNNLFNLGNIASTALLYQERKNSVEKLVSQLVNELNLLTEVNDLVYKDDFIIYLNAKVSEDPVMLLQFKVIPQQAYRVELTTIDSGGYPVTDLYVTEKSLLDKLAELNKDVVFCSKLVDAMNLLEGMAD